MNTTLDVRSPFNNESLGTVPVTSTEQALSRAARMARQMKARLRDFPIAKRYEALEKFAQKMLAAREDIVTVAVKEGGKPWTDTQVEFDRSLFSLKEALGSITKLAGHQIPMGATAASQNRMAFTERTPLGLVVAISAFNHPINLFMHQVAPALVIGAPVIYKPASETPLTSQKLVQYLHEVGFTEDDVTWMNASNETAEALIKSPDIRVLSFIGSAAVGWSLRAKAHPGTRVVLEHGGTAPVIMAPDYAPEKAVSSLTKGAFYHAGQVCISVQHIFVPEAKTSAFVEAFATAASQLKVGNPLDPKTEVGPLIRDRDLARVTDWVNEAKTSGGKIACGGKALDNRCYAPTVIVNPSTTSHVARSEVFGPVAVVWGYQDLGKVTAQINGSAFGFQASLFTNDLTQAWAVGRELETAAVLVNDHTAFRVDWMPFQGIKQSGLGTGGILPTMEHYSYEKLWVFKT